jgi:hypothetical protein
MQNNLNNLVGFCKICVTFWHKTFKDTNYFWEHCPRKCQMNEFTNHYFKFRPAEFWDNFERVYSDIISDP